MHYGASTQILSFSRYYSATDFSISLKFGTVFDHVISNTLQTFQGQRSCQGHSVIQNRYKQNISLRFYTMSANEESRIVEI